MKLSKPQFINLYDGNCNKLSDEIFMRVKKIFYENTLGKNTEVCYALPGKLYLWGGSGCDSVLLMTRSCVYLVV